jgi:hypothetical protein
MPISSVITDDRQYVLTKSARAKFLYLHDWPRLMVLDPDGK